MYDLVSVLRNCTLMVSSRFHAIVTSMPGLVSVGRRHHGRAHPQPDDRPRPPGPVPRGRRPRPRGSARSHMLRRLDREAERIRAEIAAHASAASSQLMGQMGIDFVDEVMRVYPEFPRRDLPRTWEAHLPPLAARRARDHGEARMSFIETHARERSTRAATKPLLIEVHGKQLVATSGARSSSSWWRARAASCAQRGVAAGDRVALIAHNSRALGRGRSRHPGRGRHLRARCTTARQPRELAGMLEQLRAPRWCSSTRAKLKAELAAAWPEALQRSRCSTSVFAHAAGRRRARARAHAERPRHHDLHLGHQRRAQGRAVHGRQRRLHARSARSTACARWSASARAPTGVPLPAVLLRGLAHPAVDAARRAAIRCWCRPTSTTWCRSSAPPTRTTSSTCPRCSSASAPAWATSSSERGGLALRAVPARAATADAQRARAARRSLDRLALAVGQARGLPQDQAADRQEPRVLDLRLGAAQRGDPALVRAGRHPRVSGVRAHRDHRDRHHGQQGPRAARLRGPRHRRRGAQADATRASCSCRGPNIFPEYWKRPEATAKSHPRRLVPHRRHGRAHGRRRPADRRSREGPARARERPQRRARADRGEARSTTARASRR